MSASIPKKMSSPHIFVLPNWAPSERIFETTTGPFQPWDSKETMGPAAAAPTLNHPTIASGRRSEGQFICFPYRGIHGDKYIELSPDLAAPNPVIIMLKWPFLGILLPSFTQKNLRPSSCRILSAPTFPEKLSFSESKATWAKTEAPENPKKVLVSNHHAAIQWDS